MVDSSRVRLVVEAAAAYDQQHMSLRIQYLPLYATGVSAATLVVYSSLIYARNYLRKSTSPSANITNDHGIPKNRFLRHVAARGGKWVFISKALRFDATFAYLAMTFWTAMKQKWSTTSLVLLATADYMALLSTLDVAATLPVSLVVSRHLTAVALVTFASYAYRDVWPLATFTLQPADAAEGPVLWVKIALLVFMGVIEPLVEPTAYIPASPEDSTIPNPEQTASLASLLSFSFLDSIIWKAFRLPHLAYDQLPTLSNYDQATYLVARGYPYLDPFTGANRSSLFWGLVKVFRRTLVEQSLILIIMAAARIASPIATKQLLEHLEQRGEDSFVRPWFWIVLIAFGPITYTLSNQLYRLLSSVTSVRLESIITSLVFDHALRIRLKTEASGDIKATGTAAESSAQPEEGNNTTKENAQNKNLVGKLNNLVTSDLDNITGGRDFLLVFLSAPLDIALSMWFLYHILGWSSIIGLVGMMILFPLPTFVASFLQKAEVAKMQATDARVQGVTEMMNSLRMIKLFGWESHVREKTCQKREEELIWVWRRKILEICSGILNHVIPMVHMVVTFTIYTLVMKQKLNASIVFSSLGAFNILRDHIYEVFFMMPSLIRARVSLRRAGDFLTNAEMLDCYTKQPPTALTGAIAGNRIDDIGLGAAEFTWRTEPTKSAPLSVQRFRLHVPANVTFRKGGFNLIIGPTGSGKTSLLMALLGEMHYIPLDSSSWLNLPREGGVAYAAQEAWVQNATIKENNIFESPHDEERYQKVLYQCGLERDLDILEAGDATEVGEMGVTLSGGQKARISLARAVYSSASILLLDDVLSALDAHTARWIVNKCFNGDLVCGRTVILVTHNIALVRPITDFMVSLTHDGRIGEQGTIDETLAANIELAKDVAHEEEVIEKETETIAEELKPTENKPGSTLVIAEEVELGHIGKSALMLFLAAMGGRWATLFWSSYVFALAMSEIFDSIGFWWLGWWAKQYTLRPPEEVSIPYYLGIYGLIIGILLLFHVGWSVLYTGATLRSSRTIHRKLITALAGSMFRWLDVTPVSRVITRCTQDIQAVDGPVAQYLNWLSVLGVSMATKLGAILIYAPVFILAALAVAIVGGCLGQIYMKAQLPVKREMSNAKSPVLGIFGGAIAGLTSIRAYGAQQAFRDETKRRIDRYVRCARTFFALNCWISVRIDSLSALFAASLAFYLTYRPTYTNPSTIGFTLIMATSFSQMVLWFVQSCNEFEVSGNSLERIQQYLVVEQEPQPTGDGRPPAHWPSSGELRVETLSARYSSDGPEVLKNISFAIKSGERVGIVGRTGSGKSTLTLSLLRCIHTSGTVYFDGIPTNGVNLDALRSNITIIPQAPELLSGTLRHNLDIFGQYDDATLNGALRAAGLFSLQQSESEGRITLDTAISGSGSNLSVGQRQIIALARAILRQSKLLILDEATSAIDYDTDAVIQKSLRTELKSDVTILTVAHRLQTIMDSDRIMVLDEGRIVEFDSPAILMENEKSFLRALVEESAEKETLRGMIERKA